MTLYTVNCILFLQLLRYYKRLCEGVVPNLRKDDSCDSTLAISTTSLSTVCSSDSEQLQVNVPSKKIHFSRKFKFLCIFRKNSFNGKF